MYSSLPKRKSFHVSYPEVVLISSGRMIQLEVHPIWRERSLVWEPFDLILVQCSDFCYCCFCTDRKVLFTRCQNFLSWLVLFALKLQILSRKAVLREGWGCTGAVVPNCTLTAVASTTQQLQSSVPFFLQENINSSRWWFQNTNMV